MFGEVKIGPTTNQFHLYTNLMFLFGTIILYNKNVQVFFSSRR